MRILLTGITGNLGFEVADQLNKKGIEVVPLIHPKDSFQSVKGRYHEIVMADLLNLDKSFAIKSRIDFIIHCAGAVNFKTAGSSNQNMMRSIIQIAESLEAPIYHLSTAFLFKPDKNDNYFHNSYEHDKYHAEKILDHSEIPHSIIRPSVLTGNTRTGAIRNFSGYYLMVERFLAAAKWVAQHGQKVRFPNLTGTSNMVPVDQAATVIVDLATSSRLTKLVYITNPAPPKTMWVLEETLDFLAIKKCIDIINCDFPTYTKMIKTPGEKILHHLGMHMSPYWSLAYNFPESALGENPINSVYLSRILQYYREQTDHANHESKN